MEPQVGLATFPIFIMSRYTREVALADTKCEGGFLFIRLWKLIANEYLKTYSNISKQGAVHDNKIPLKAI